MGNYFRTEMTFKSHIYDRKEIDDSTNRTGFILLLLLCLLGYLLTDIYETLGATILLFSALGSMFYFYKDWGKKEPEGKYVGELILSGDYFVIDKDTVNTSDIDDLKIEIGHPKGFKLWHRFGYTVSSGATSKMELVVKSYKRQFNFQLLSEGQLRDLKQILEKLYLKGIFVKEFYLGNRTYLLEELDYEDIQEFKRKYRLT